MKKIIASLMTVVACQISFALDALQTNLLQTIDNIEQVFKVQYAMTEWKGQHTGWDFDR